MILRMGFYLGGLHFLFRGGDVKLKVNSVTKGYLTYYQLGGVV